MKVPNTGDNLKAVKTLARAAFVPLTVAAEMADDFVETIPEHVLKPSKLASNLIDMRINTLETVTKVIEREINLLEKYREELEAGEAGEAEKKEKVKVE
jgi:hypothetical protein